MIARLRLRDLQPEHFDYDHCVCILYEYVVPFCMQCVCVCGVV